MRFFYQIVLTMLVGFGSLYCGIVNYLSPSNILLNVYHMDISIYCDEARLAIESQIRLLSGMWIAAGIFTFFSVRNFESNTNILRLILLGLSLGAIGELISAIVLKGDLQAVAIKVSLQIIIYIVLELWKNFMVKKTCLRSR